MKVGTIGETAVVRMVLDAWTGAQLVTLLETKVDEWFRTGSLPEHLQPTGDDDEDARRRTLERPRLLAEAFAELVEEMLGLAGTRGGSPVNVTFLGSADIHADGGAAEILVPGREAVPVPAETPVVPVVPWVPPVAVPVPWVVPAVPVVCVVVVGSPGVIPACPLTPEVIPAWPLVPLWTPACPQGCV